MENIKIIAVLLNFKRPLNLPLVINSIRKQSVPIKIMLWHNGVDDQIDGADWVIRSNRNMGCLVRWYMATLADADYYFTLDDDLELGSTDLIEKCIKTSKEYGDESIIGRSGTVIGKGLQKYSSRPNLDKFSKGDQTYVDIIKGRFMFVPAKLFKLVPMVFKDYRGRGDDIWISLLTGNKKNSHILRKDLVEGFKELPGLNVGLSKKGKEHYFKRDIIIAKLIAGKFVKWYGSTLMDLLNAYIIDIYAWFLGLNDHRQSFSKKIFVFINDGSIGINELESIRKILLRKFQDQIQIIEWRYPKATGEPFGNWVIYSNSLFDINPELIAIKLFALSGSKEMYQLKKEGKKDYSMIKKSINSFKKMKLK